MKKILSTILATVLLCAVVVSVSSCTIIDTVKSYFVSMEKIEEKCEELEREGEIDGYTYSKLTNTITVKGDDWDDVCVITEYDTKSEAELAYSKLYKARQEAEELFEELKEGAKEYGRELDMDFEDFLEEYNYDVPSYLKRYDTIVVYGDEELCKKVV